VREICGESFIFQQDSAPPHRACETIGLLEWETPLSSTRPLAPNSPDLNPVDYRILGEMQQRHRCTRRKFMALMNWCRVRYRHAVAASDVWIGRKHDQWRNGWRKSLRAC